MTELDKLDPEQYQRLIRVAQRITAQRDVARTCETILEEAQALTHADGGTLYLAEGRDHDSRLEFAIVRNHSLGLHLGGSTGGQLDYPPLPLFYQGKLNHSHIAAHAALTGEVVNIADAYDAEDFDFSGTRDFDQRFGYRSASILAVPLQTDMGELVAVMQLLNAREPDTGETIAFDERHEQVVSVLAGFAAMALQQQRIMHDQRELLVTLSGEPNTGRLLERILNEAQSIGHADGGTLYLLRDDNDGAERLEFALVRNDSLGINQGGSTDEPVTLDPVPLTDEAGEPNHHHIAAHAAITGRLINVVDAYESSDFDFSGTQNFDEQHGYRSTSFLTVPLLNHLDEVIGVLQLVNARHPETGEIIPFTEQIEPLIQALASYAAIALNNQILVQELKDLLDAFIQVIARAIDAKSSHTSKHCQRVPLLTELIADAACKDQDRFDDFRMDDDEWYELHVAAWMHDCGKLATPDSVLDKSTKLHTLHDRIEEVAARFAVLRQQKENEYLQAVMENPERRQELHERHRDELRQLEEDLEFLRTANKGGEFMADEDKDRVRRLARLSWLDSAGRPRPLLTDDEVHNLCIERGTLSPEERDVINDHVRVSIDMLESLPFPRRLRRVPEYAGGHHEKMDGSGFPRGLTRDEMSVPARMMVIADIFEALTAKERPYKEPMKLSKALSILQNMRDENHIDPDVYELFVRHRVWEAYAREALDAEQLDIEDASAYL